MAMSTSTTADATIKKNVKSHEKMLDYEGDVRFTDARFLVNQDTVTPRLKYTFKRSDTPPKFKTGLYEHQKTTLQALMDIEDRRHVILNAKHKIPIDSVKQSNNSNTTICDIHACKLGDQLGSGKTIIILALICSSPIPQTILANQMYIPFSSYGESTRSHTSTGSLIRHRNRSEYGFHTVVTNKNPTKPHKTIDNHVRELRSKSDNSSFGYDITCKYDSIIRATIVVAGKAILRQWEDAVHRFTSLRCFVVYDSLSLIKFMELYNTNNIQSYDIILLKNTTSRTFAFVDEVSPNSLNTNTSNPHFLPDIMARICRKTPFARAIYDDFDTAKYPDNVNCINALFTIFVSTTMQTSASNNRSNVKHLRDLDSSNNMGYTLPVQRMLAAFELRHINEVYNDMIMNRVVNVRNDEEYVNASTNIPTYNIFKCVYQNNAESVTKLIAALGANEIAEMINGDALHTAADAIGILDHSPFDIFRKLLQDKMGKFAIAYHKRSLIHSIIYQLRTEDIPQLRVANKSRCSKLGGGEDSYSDSELDSDDYQEVNHTPEQINTIMALLKSTMKKEMKVKCPCIRFTEISRYKSHNLSNSIRMFGQELDAEYDIINTEIRRMKDNISEQMCVVCKMDTAGENICIPRCCSNIIDAECFKAARPANRSIICPGCGNIVDPLTSVAYINSEFDLESLIDKDIELDVMNTIAENNKEGSGVLDEYLKSNPKMLALLDIINGKTPETASEVKFTMNAVVKGNVDLPRAGTTKTKILLFANYAETLQHVEEFLNMNDIKFLALRGSIHQVTNTIAKFKDEKDIPIMLINSAQNCAGLNLQFATDIVFFHKLIDQHIESQVVGRAQRIGRKDSLKVYYLLYKAEAIAVDHGLDIMV